MTTVLGRVAAGPAGPSTAAATGRAGPAVIGKALHRRAAAGPAVVNVSSEASRVGPVCHVIPVRAAVAPAIGKVVPIHGPKMGM